MNNAALTFLYLKCEVFEVLCSVILHSFTCFTLEICTKLQITCNQGAQASNFTVWVSLGQTGRGRGVVVCISLNAVASGNQFKLTQVYCFNVCWRLKRASVSVAPFFRAFGLRGDGATWMCALSQGIFMSCRRSSIGLSIMELQTLTDSLVNISPRLIL